MPQLAGAAPPAATLTMTATNFTTHAVTVRAGDQVAFVDPSGGGRHDLYFGNHGLFIANKNGPSDLNNKAGVVFNPGDSKTYTFSTPGVYEVTCATQPLMNVIITVR
jgi:plastocyanin